MARSSSGIVAGLTVAAVAAVGFLAFQASANVPDNLGRANASATPKASASKTPGKSADPAALPASSGTGERVVYATGTDRVWLVAANNKVRRTFEVTPGTVDPTVGTYAVTTRANAVTGSDGVQIEHVVRFTSVDGVAIGFSAAVDGTTTAPDASKKLGGIRESREDGTALWNFATVGVKIVVLK
ncbi:hypothetical protein [Streptomyces sp. NPDC050535]|uniref:hypothetical protein n=1 Tax=Streptomyces sp. NPDC050535 TaxID=3365626 RepID=UPI0037A71E9F